MKLGKSRILKEGEVLLGFLLSKEHETLPEAEAKTIIEKFLDGTPIKKSHNLLIAKIPANTDKILEAVKRLAYTKQVFHIISEFENVTELNSKILKGEDKPESPFLEKNKKLTFKANSLNLEHEKRSFIDILEFAKNLSLYPNIGKAKMKSPDANFYSIYSKTVFFGVEIWHNEEKFIKRRADNRPANHPTAMSPKLARALVNLSGAKKEILDPFCGAGGILIESSLMGLNSTGIDIDFKMTIRAKLNLESFKLKNFEVLKQNALEYNKRSEAVVTDIPYGKSSKLDQDIKDLVRKFLEKYQNLTKKIVIVHPSTLKLKELIRNTKWKILDEHEIYVHKSLTRVVNVLELQSASICL